MIWTYKQWINLWMPWIVARRRWYLMTFSSSSILSSVDSFFKIQLCLLDIYHSFRAIWGEKRHAVHTTTITTTCPTPERYASSPSYGLKECLMWLVHSMRVSPLYVFNQFGGYRWIYDKPCPLVIPLIPRFPLNFFLLEFNPFLGNNITTCN